MATVVHWEANAELYTVVCFFVFATSQRSVAAGFLFAFACRPLSFFPLLLFQIGAICHHYMTNCFIIIRHSQ